MKFVLLIALFALGGCPHEWEYHQFGYIPQSMVKAPPGPSPDAIGRSHNPYRGKPAYLAEARPLLPTNDAARAAPTECAAQSRVCDDRLRATLAALDGQILALSTPPTELQLTALRLQTAQLAPLLVPYPDMMSERDELVALAGKFPSLSAIDQGPARRRMTELTDLIRVQLAAAQ